MLYTQVSRSQCKSKSKTQCEILPGHRLEICVYVHIFTLTVMCCEVFSFSLSATTKGDGGEVISLGWQRVRQLPDHFLKMVLFSACLSLFFSAGNVSTAAPCPAHSLSRHCPPSASSLFDCAVLCFQPQWIPALQRQ